MPHEYMNEDVFVIALSVHLQYSTLQYRQLGSHTLEDAIIFLPAVSQTRIHA
jgi:hypothetical protein